MVLGRVSTDPADEEALEKKGKEPARGGTAALGALPPSKGLAPNAGRTRSFFPPVTSGLRDRATSERLLALPTRGRAPVPVLAFARRSSTGRVPSAMPLPMRTTAANGVDAGRGEKENGEALLAAVTLRTIESADFMVDDSVSAAGFAAASSERTDCNRSFAESIRASSDAALAAALMGGSLALGLELSLAVTSVTARGARVIAGAVEEAEEDREVESVVELDEEIDVGGTDSPDDGFPFASSNVPKLAEVEAPAKDSLTISKSRAAEKTKLP